MEREKGSLLASTAGAVDAYGMFRDGDRVLVGLSGGADSVALLHLLFRLRGKYSITLGACHLNHGLRGEASDGDALFAEGVARKLGVPFYMEARDVKGVRRSLRLSLEEAARRVRYDFYRTVAAQHGYDRIALGHHRDDNAELILMNLIRGTGPRGLSGIPPVRDGKIVRPLIRSTRADIEAFLKAEGLSHIHDASNDDTAFLRNRIRKSLLPELKREYNPAMAETLNRLGAVMAGEEEWLEDVVAPLYEGTRVLQEKGRVVLSLSRLGKQHPAAILRIFRRAVREVKGDVRGIFLSHLTAALDLVKQGRNRSIDLPHRLRVRLVEDRIEIKQESRALRELPPEPVPSPYAYTVDLPGSGGSEVHIPEAGVFMRFSIVERADCRSFHDTGQHTAFFDMVKLRFPLNIRNFRPGDRFTPLGMKGSQKVKSFFINSKVSKSQRAKCPILLSEGTVVWIAGHRLDDRFKVGLITEKLLKVELLFA